jgi:hypothetical protein
MATSKRWEGQQRRTMMNKFMNNVKTSTSMYWKDDSPMNKNINKSLNMNMSNSASRNLINNKMGKKANNGNKAVNRKSIDKASNVNNRFIESSINNSDSCSINSRVNDSNEFDNSVIFSPSGSKNNSVKQQNVEAILNDDYERFQNDNTTKNKMNLNNDIENDVLSRSIINADTNGCSDTFGTLSSSKDMVGNNLNERFEENNTIVNTINYINKKPLEVLLSSEISDNVDKQINFK